MKPTFFKINTAHINSQTPCEYAQVMCTLGTSLLKQINECLSFLSNLSESSFEVSRAEFLQLKRLQRFQSWFEVLDVYTSAINVDRKLNWPSSIAILDSLTMLELAYLAGEINDAFKLPAALEKNQNAVTTFCNADTMLRYFLARYGATIKLVFYTKFLHSELVQSLQSINLKTSLDTLRQILPPHASQELVDSIITVEIKKSELESVFSQIISTGYLSLNKDQKMLYNTFPEEINAWKPIFEKIIDTYKNNLRSQSTYQNTIKNLFDQVKTIQSDLGKVIKVDSTIYDKMKKKLGVDYAINLSVITVSDITNFQLQMVQTEKEMEAETKIDNIGLSEGLEITL